MKQYRYNCLTNTLTLSRAFVRQAENVESEEYKFVQRMRDEIPGLTIVRQEKQIHRRSPRANLSVRAMREYIGCIRDSERRLAELDSVVSASKGQEHPLLYIRNWFMENYPAYYSIPVFDEEGFLLPDAVSPRLVA
ncbi:MAG: hypothetical protein IKF90_12450 [Parasporobacterium sp.]|nr:hypothetical protein [Parasporobacterium sp.]